MQCLLGKKTLELEILKEGLEQVGSEKVAPALATPRIGRFAVSPVAGAAGVA